MGLANISLVGNLIKAPEQTQFASGRIKTTMVLAVDTNPKNAQEKGAPDFFRIETWGKLAELANQYLGKGSQVTVSGRLVLNHWIDKEGVARITHVVEANQLSLPPKYAKKGEQSVSFHGTQENDDYEGASNSQEELANSLFKDSKKLSKREVAAVT
jgi:single-strand DNA-binding protein